MRIEEILNSYKDSQSLSEEHAIEVLKNLRKEAIDYLRKVPNRKFAQDLLSFVVGSRYDPDGIGSGENIMLAYYLIAIHKNVEDALSIWRAKVIDFDSYCYVDIQLVVCSGVEETIEYLKEQESEEAIAAIEYISECQEAGDFDALASYFSDESYPWFV